MIQVSWFSPIYELAGYSEVARNLLLELSKLDLDIHLVPEEWDKPLIVIQKLKKLIKPATKDSIHVYQKVGAGFQRTGRYNIGYTVFETTRLHPSWVTPCNRMNEIWTCSSFCRNVFKQSRLKPEIYIIPHGVDVQRYNPNVKPIEISNKRRFSFLSVFSGTYKRKGLGVLVKAFTSEFNNDEPVCLILKFYKPLDEMRQTIIRMANQLTKPAPILFINKPIPFDKMPSLYKAADCLVSASRGEAWNLTCSEALSMELPVIATKWGGHLEYMNEQNSFPLKVNRLVQVNMREIRWYQARMEWADPSVEHLRELMRYVYEHQREAKEKGKRGREDMIKNYQWKHAAKKAYERLSKA